MPAAAFVDAAEAVMLAAGMIPLILAGGRYRSTCPRPRHRRRRGGGDATGTRNRPTSWQMFRPGDLARRSTPRPPAARRDGSWRLRCPVHRGLHRDSLSIARGRDQAIVWHCFAGCPLDESRPVSRSSSGHFRLRRGRARQGCRRAQRAGAAQRSGCPARREQEEKPNSHDLLLRPRNSVLRPRNGRPARSRRRRLSARQPV